MTARYLPLGWNTRGSTPVNFILLTLSREDMVLSANLYRQGVGEGNFEAIRQLPKVDLEATTTGELDGESRKLTARLHNPSAHPALMVRSKGVREKSVERILPASFTDNNISLMAGERCFIRVEIANADMRREKSTVTVAGFNVGT